MTNEPPALRPIDSADLVDLIDVLAAMKVDMDQAEHEAQRSFLLDVLAADPDCPVCGRKGIPVADDRGISYHHDGRAFHCRVTPKLLERP